MMGWKWDDIVELLRATGLFTEEQLTEVGKVVKSKKHELAETLAVLARQDDDGARRATEPDTEHFHTGRASAFREVRDAVKP